MIRALLAALLLVGCSSPDRPLQFNLGLESVQLDWNRAFDTTSAVVLDNIMEGLTSYSDSVAGGSDVIRPLPALASSWSLSEDGTVYRFHLRVGVNWSDGVPLEAQHFVDSWQRLLAPESRSANAYHLFDIVNAQAFNEGKEKDFSNVGVKALGKHILEVRLKRQVPYFLHLVAATSTFPIRKDLIERHGDLWTEPENLVTLGPYRLTEWVQGDRIVLQASLSYSGSRPIISRVICRLIAEPLTAFALYENGALDVMPRGLPSAFVQKLQSSPDYRTGPKLQVSFLLFNTRRPPFDKPENRLAFIRALNRNGLASHFPSTQTPTAGWIPPGLLGYQAGVGVQSGGVESKRLQGENIEMRFSGSGTWSLVFQSISDQLAERLKAKVRLQRLEPSEYASFLAQLNSRSRPRQEQLPHVMHLGWVADYPDSHSFMNVFTSSSESNYGHWSNRRYDQLVERAAASEDENVRAELYLQAQKLLLEEEAVIMPLFITSHQALVRPSLKGVHLNVLDKWYFKNLSFEREGWRGYGRSLIRRIQGTRFGDAGA